MFTLQGQSSVQCTLPEISSHSAQCIHNMSNSTYMNHEYKDRNKLNIHQIFIYLLLLHIKQEIFTHYVVDV